MEDKSDSGQMALLLGNGGHGSRRLGQRNSYNTLINDFISRLPEKVRAGLDPESPEVIDCSRAEGLSEGEKEYYEKQFATLKSFEEVDCVVAADTIDEEVDCVIQIEETRDSAHQKYAPHRKSNTAAQKVNKEFNEAAGWRKKTRPLPDRFV